MDDLDKQLAELQLLADKEKLQQHGTLGKKIGPAVPPKPKKATQPLVPQSYSINQQLEPSYSGRLNTTPQYYANVGSTPELVSNQQQYANLPNDKNNSLSEISPSNHYANLQMNKQQPHAQVMHISHAQPQQARISNTLLNSSPKPYTSSSAPLAQHTNNSVTYSNLMDDGVIYSNLAHIPNTTGPSASVGSGGPRACAGVIYSNVASGVGDCGRIYSEADDLPPPPPPPPIVNSKNSIDIASTPILNSGSTLADYAPCTVNTDLPPPPDDFPPPPSPVSSSYSELRRATEPIGQDGGGVYGGYGLGSQRKVAVPGYEYYSNYGGMSQSSSTYESIYEPINPPRPPSQMSSRSNYSLYTPYGGSSSSAQMTCGGPTPSASRMDHHHHHQQPPKVVGDGELDVQSHCGTATGGDDVYGVCVKCGETVIGENSGCTAMEQIYHTKCFTCHHCAINLQGKPFYSLDGNPYCSEDYLNTLEKCCVCMNPILDRILRATGKPYHPKCFTCVICGKSLDGIPFTVDATNQIHCIDDFHKKFAPRCCVCNQPIMPEPGREETVRVVALDRSFHIQCYKCEDCSLVLSSEAEGRGCYPLDNHVLCKSCNAKRVQTLTSHMTTDL